MSELDRLVNTGIYILRETKAQFKNPCVLWSTGKDSTTTISLCREAFFGEVPFPVVHIDTGWKFKEIYEFRDRLAKEWNLKLIVAKSPLAGKINPTFRNVTYEKCCHQLKTLALKEAIEKHGFDVVIVSIRRDEHYMRGLERVSSPRDKNFRWRFLHKKGGKEEGDAPFVDYRTRSCGTFTQATSERTFTTLGGTLCYIGRSFRCGVT